METSHVIGGVFLNTGFFFRESALLELPIKLFAAKMKNYWKRGLDHSALIFKGSLLKKENEFSYLSGPPQLPHFNFIVVYLGEKSASTLCTSNTFNGIS
ncbi:hypothetical protein TNIN_334411 [Trichonephila inaurata madagascariensis]|uniref:Uncharacterized protein n=1 Tax=Trichonephila inaurata madagascariensis TaxID=2747483 RepID=A0A8X7C979_9ARAC|nr:hypothetical protein TNIN_334411 [Trichonephila inaurata madagascariensis]